MSENSRRPSRGPMGRGRMNGEKAKDFSGAVKKLLRYRSAQDTVTVDGLIHRRLQISLWLSPSCR